MDETATARIRALEAELSQCRHELVLSCEREQRYRRVIESMTEGFGPDGKMETTLVVDCDIGELKRPQTSLEELTLMDSLTGVANRRYLERFLEREWRREARHHLPVALIVVDVDHFKAYNDRYGHVQGDYCLWRVAVALRQSLHRADTLVRYGGEEFIVVLPDSDVSAAQEIAERLRQAVEGLKLPHAYAQTSQVTVSLGVAAIKAHEGEFGDLMAAADVALYRAKRNGRNRIETGP